MAADSTSPADRVKGIFSGFLRDVASDEVIGSSNADEGEQISPSAKTSADRSPIKLRSKDAFFARIETYSPSQWYAKCSSLSPLVCSKYGWENIDEEFLKCVSCGAHLDGVLPDPSSDTFEKCCSSLRSSLVSAHKRFCYWSTNPCPDSFLQVPHYNYSDVRKEARLSYQHFSKLKQALPVLDFKSLDRWGFGEESAKELAEKLELSSGTTQPSSRSASAAALAVTGWATSSNSDVIVCSHCRRQVGLWIFKADCQAESNGGSANGDHADSKDENGDCDSSVEPEAKKRRLSRDSSAAALDPVEEHRHWCPWITNPDGAVPTPPKDPSVLWSSSNGSSERIVSGDDVGLSKSPKAPEARQEAGEGMSSAGGVQSPCREGRDKEGRADLANTPGWLRTAKVILSEGGYHGDKCSLRNSIEGLRSVRHLLIDWSSPVSKSN